MNNKKNGSLTSSAASPDLDPEMLNNLDMLVDYQVVDQISQDDQQLETLEKLEELSDEKEVSQ